MAGGIPRRFLIASSYERSECYANIAGATRNPWACWKVRRLGAIRPWEDQLTLWSCFRRAQIGSRVATGVSDETLLSYFAAMGYDVDTLHLEGVTPPVVSVQEIYRSAALMPGIAHRIAAARSVASRPDVRRLLAQLGIEISRGRDLPPQRVAEAYRLFLGALTNPRDTKHLEARKRFVRRVIQLDRS